MKKINVLDLFTIDQVKSLAKLKISMRTEFIKENHLDRINSLTKQENESRYLAYMVEYANGVLEE